MLIQSQISPSENKENKHLHSAKRDQTRQNTYTGRTRKDLKMRTGYEGLPIHECLELHKKTGTESAESAANSFKSDCPKTDSAELQAFWHL
jgi:hypothetical protein